MNKSTLALHYAHANRLSTWRRSVRRGWWLVRFREQLARKIISFQYYKSDGSIRRALGTLNMNLIPENLRPGASSRQTGGVASAEKGKSYTAFTYFDLTKNNWRSFRIDNLLSDEFLMWPIEIEE